MLAVEHIVHHYGGQTALHGISFSVERGEVVGFLGPNGAGKSTTMRVITGYLTPTSGRVSYDGHDVGKDPMRLRRRLGYLPENVPLYPELRVAEYLAWVAKVKGGPPAQVTGVMERCGLADMGSKLIRHLSKGYRQRVGLAQAILGEAELLILDEPTVGLDPAQIKDIRELIIELGKERTVLLSTHILPEVERVCDRVVIIHQGRIKAQGAPAALTQSAAATEFHLVLGLTPDAVQAVAAAYAGLEGVAGVSPLVDTGSARGLARDIRLDIRAAGDRDIRAALSGLAADKGWPLLELSPNRAGLEEVFVNLTRHEGTRPDTKGAEDEA